MKAAFWVHVALLGGTAAAGHLWWTVGVGVSLMLLVPVEKVVKKMWKTCNYELVNSDNLRVGGDA